MAIRGARGEEREMGGQGRRGAYHLMSYSSGRWDTRASLSIAYIDLAKKGVCWLIDERDKIVEKNSETDRTRHGNIGRSGEC